MDTPRPSPRTNRTCRVPHPVLIGHAASLTPRAAPQEGFPRRAPLFRAAPRCAARADGAAPAPALPPAAPLSHASSGSSVALDVVRLYDGPASGYEAPAPGHGAPERSRLSTRTGAWGAGYEGGWQWGHASIHPGCGMVSGMMSRSNGHTVGGKVGGKVGEGGGGILQGGAGEKRSGQAPGSVSPAQAAAALPGGAPLVLDARRGASPGAQSADPGSATRGGSGAGPWEPAGAFSPDLSIAFLPPPPLEPFPPPPAEPGVVGGGARGAQRAAEGAGGARRAPQGSALPGARCAGAPPSRWRADALGAIPADAARGGEHNMLTFQRECISKAFDSGRLPLAVPPPRPPARGPAVRNGR